MAIYDAPESLHVGTGTETVFGFNWPYLLPRDLRVTVNGIAVVTVLASPNQVAIVPAPAALAIVRIYRNTPAQNPTYLFATGIPMLPKYIDGNNKQLLYALQEGLLQFAQTQITADAALEAARLAQVAAEEAAASAAQQARDMRRTVRVPTTDPEIPALPPVAARAGKVMGFDALGNPVGVLPATGSGTELALDLASGIPGKGGDMVGYQDHTVTAELNRTYKSAAAFYASPLIHAVGSRILARTGAVWDVVAAGTGDYTHPVTGQALKGIVHDNAFMVARNYDVHRANSGSVNYAGIQLALDKMADRDGGALELPYSTDASQMQVAGRIHVPDNSRMTGSSWRTCVLLFTTANGGISYGSGTIIGDIDCRGGKVAQHGCGERGEFNRSSLYRMRFQDFTRWNWSVGMAGAANNSLFTDIQAKFAGEVNFAVGQALNCTFFQTNGDLDAASGPNARGIKVFDLFPGSLDGNKQCRNSMFIKGIYERGASDYQLEVERATGLQFHGTEFNNGLVATSLIKKGIVQLYSPYYSLNATNLIMEADQDSAVDMYHPMVSGAGGRALAEMLRGPIRVNGRQSIAALSANLRYQPVGTFGNAVAVRDALTGTRLTSTTGGGANRVTIGASSGVTVSGKPRVTEIRITVSAIAAGAPKAYLSLTQAPNRILAGTLALGLNVFSVVTDQPSIGNVDIIADAAYDCTILTVETHSY